ncbi:MAG: hypothetical protein K2X82_01120 [Gemmataceae bacterium]|nr:hypothetical protein [Gemmataceae bacterium]
MPDITDAEDTPLGVAVPKKLKESAERFARSRRETLRQVVMDALRRHMASASGRLPPLPRPPRPPLPDRLPDTPVGKLSSAKIARRFHAGESATALAAAAGVSRARVYQVLIKLGVARQPRAPRRW